MATGCLVSPTTPRNEALEGALISAGHIETKVFAVALKYLWKLAVGDIDANLDALRQLPAPREETTLRIWSLFENRILTCSDGSGCTPLAPVPVVFGSS